MIIRCVHCGYEGAKEGFQYLYKARLEYPGGWRRRPKGCTPHITYYFAE